MHGDAARARDGLLIVQQLAEAADAPSEERAAARHRRARVALPARTLVIVAGRRARDLLTVRLRLRVA